MVIGKVVKNAENIVILGTKCTQNLNWNNHVTKGQDSLINQLKRRASGWKLIVNKLDIKSAKKLANSLLIGKIHYNIDVWGLLSRTVRNKVEKISINTARIILKNESFGKTDEQVLKIRKWFNIKDTYENTICKTTFKVINGSDNHKFKDECILNW